MGVTPTPAASPATAVKPGPAGAPVDAQPLQSTPEFLADLFSLSEVAFHHTPSFLLCCMTSIIGAHPLFATPLFGLFCNDVGLCLS